MWCSTFAREVSRMHDFSSSSERPQKFIVDLQKKFYHDVVEQLLEQSRTLWEEDGLDDASLIDLKQLWETKLLESGIDLSRDNAVPENDHATTSKSSSRAKSKSQSASGSSKAQQQKEAVQQPQPTPQPPRQQVQTPQQPPAPVHLPVQEHSQHSQIVQITQQQQQNQQHLILQQQQQQKQIQQHHQLLLQQQLQQNAQYSHALQGSGLQQHNQNLQNTPTTVNINPNRISVSSLNATEKQHSGSNNVSGGHSFNLMAPLSGPIVHLSSTSVPNNNSTLSNLNRQQNMTPTFVTVGGATQILLSNPQAQFRTVVSPQSLQQNQLPLQLRDDRSVNSLLQQHSRNNSLQQQQLQNMGRSSQTPGVTVVNPTHIDIHSLQQKLRQQQAGIITLGNQQQFNINPGLNNPGVFSMNNNNIFHSSGLGQPSVIHVVDSSGNQQPMNVLGSASNSNSVTPAKQSGATGIRKPGSQPLTLQLDGEDDDDDFEDLSDDDRPPPSSNRPAKKMKTSRGSAERLEEPDLGSEDDDDYDPNSSADVVDNVVVCQYEKVSRTRNKWKLHLKSGMCSLNGKEYVFHKAVGDAEF